VSSKFPKFHKNSPYFS